MAASHTRRFVLRFFGLLNRDRVAIIFIAKLSGLYVAWELLFIAITTNARLFWSYLSFVQIIRDLLLNFSAALLRVCGWEVTVGIETVGIKQSMPIHVGGACVGIELAAAAVGLALAYPASLKQRLFFCAFGTTLVFVLNAVRIAGLAILIYKADMRIFQINHHFVFQAIVLVAILLAWVAWINKMPVRASSD